MYRIISLLGLLGITAAVVWAIRSQWVQVAGTKQSLRQQSLEVANDLRQWRSLPAPALLHALARFFYLATLGCILALAVTGFLPVIVFGAAVSNLALVLHLLLAPVFAVGITALALYWAQRHRFNQKDWDYLRRGLRQEKLEAPPGSPHVWQKLCFWSALVLAMPVIVTTLLMMSPQYGTPGQKWLLHVHGYASLLLLAVAVLHAYFAVATKREARQVVPSDAA